MSARRKQKDKATDSPGPSSEPTDEIEEDDRQEAEEETTAPTLVGELAKGQAALSGHVSALTSQLELLVTAMASSTSVQTPAAQVKSEAAPDDPEDDDDTIDRFATANNAQCVRYNSAYYDPSTEEVDAFSQD